MVTYHYLVLYALGFQLINVAEIFCTAGPICVERRSMYQQHFCAQSERQICIVITISVGRILNLATNTNIFGMSILGRIRIYSSVEFGSNMNTNIENIRIFDLNHRIFKYFKNKHFKNTFFDSLIQPSECFRTIV